MLNVVFVAPFLMDTTLRFVRETARLPEVRVALVTQQGAERVPADLRKRVVVERTDDALDPDSIAEVTRTFAAREGGVPRLLGAQRLQGELKLLLSALDGPCTRFQGLDPRTGEISMLVMVSSGHRAPVYPALQWLVDQIKARVPIWKKELFEDGSHRWVDGDGSTGRRDGMGGPKAFKDFVGRQL